MYETFTKQALPSKEYRELLGTAICVYNSNTSFLIENLRHKNNFLSWYELLDKQGNKLQIEIEKELNEIAPDICEKYKKLTQKRNRIIHSFQITYKNEQILSTKTYSPENIQFLINKDYLLSFIKESEVLSTMLYNLKNKIRNKAND